MEVNDLVLIRYLYYEEPENNHYEYEYFVGIFIEIKDNTHAKVTIYDEDTNKTINKTFPINNITKIYTNNAFTTMENFKFICDFGLCKQFSALQHINSRPDGGFL